MLFQAPASQRKSVPARHAVALGVSQLAAVPPAAAGPSFAGEEPHPASIKVAATR